jgi:UDP-N-acetylbacillosamine N-acetyltransferase
MSAKLVIWGASGHALVVADAVRQAGEYEIAGFLDDDPGRRGAPFAEATVLGGRDELVRLRERGVTHAVAAIGDCRGRVACAALAAAAGLALATVIHPRAIVAPGVRMGVGTVLAAGAIVNPGCTLGDNVIINTGATVDHECRIHDGAHLSAGVHVAGRVEVGRLAWIGIGVVVKDRVKIGAGALIGAGAVVLSDIPDDVVAFGVPARVIREIEPHERSGLSG